VIVAIGVDVCDVGRIRRALEASTGARFRARVFTLAEQAYCEARGRARFASYAARFAAKEAAMKALGTGWSAGVRAKRRASSSMDARRSSRTSVG
jgi:holo-[acyl-carrier protein] synthase